MNNYDIQLGNVKLHYYTAGSGEPIIMMHGWGQSIEAFKPIYEELQKDYKVYVLDLPGHGKSPECSESLNIFEYELVLYDFIKALNIIKPTLIGHSFGGRMSIINAAGNANINKLILTGAAGIKPSRSLKYYIAVYNYKFMKLLVKTPFYSQFKDDLLNSGGSTDYKNASPIMKETLIKVVNQDLKDYIKDINCETLLYWGETDDQTPVSDGHLMNKLIKNSTLKIIPNGSHFAYLENHNDFTNEIKKFIEKEL